MNYAAASHVEGKAAWQIRKLGSSGGKIYHNNPHGTCPFCVSQIPTLLPEGARLTVVPPTGAVAKTSRWITVATEFIGNADNPNERS